ncbi:MAG: hypothetical protein WC076_10710 [Terrimicrobiaceae bacterium]|jgi:hypothetical protein
MNSLKLALPILPAIAFLTVGGCITVKKEVEPTTTVTEKVVTVLPTGYATVLRGGVTYYTYDDVYYRTVPGGYVVVPRP